MLIFIDDSGDPGFKIERGSTEYFVIALVIFSDNLEAEKTALAIKEYRRSIGFPDDVEFKFSKMRKDYRVGFLNAVKPFKFKIRSLVIKKAEIHSEELRTHKNSFYSYAIKMALKYVPDISAARVKIDGSGDRTFKRSFVTYLRRQLNSGTKKVIDNLKLVDSKENVLIQMADMVAGAVRRSYDLSKADRNEYKSIISKCIESEWEFK